MVRWLTYRKRHSYATKSNQTCVVKTPGGKLVYQYTKKRASGPKCPVTGKKIQGGQESTGEEGGLEDAPLLEATLGNLAPTYSEH
ncbi:hypothetical protein ACJX0J_039876, partial [Zea mays]